MTVGPPSTDLRLVPAALACWAACAVGARVTVPATGPVRAVLTAAVLAAALVAAAVLVGTVPVGTVRGGAAAPGGPARRAVRAVRSGRACGHLVLTVAVCAAALVSAGTQRSVREAGPLPVLASERATARVTGTVRSDPAPLRSGPRWADERRFRVRLVAEHVSGRGTRGAVDAPVLVLAGPAWREVRYGSRVQALGTLEPTARGDDVVAVLVVRGGPHVLSPPTGLHRRVQDVRVALLRASDGLPPDQRGLVPGTAIGDTSRISDDLDAAMRVSGLTHLTAVSGAHFAIVGAAVLGLAAALGLPRGLRAALTALAMAGFVALVHPTPSVLRAAAMGAIGVAALVLGRPARAVPALAAAVVALLVVDPWLASSAGFTLSVVATAGIVLLCGPLAAGIATVVPARAARLLAVPLAAQLACGPFVLVLAPALPTYAVPANVAAAPAVVPATVLGVLAAVVAPWWGAGGEVLARGAGWATWWLASVARVAAGLPGSQLPWPAPPLGPLLLATATAGVVLGLARLRRRADPTP